MRIIESNCIVNSGRDDKYISNEYLKKLFFLLRNSQVSIPQQCKGFFEHPGHLENQFKWLTGSNGLTTAVEANFKQQISMYQKEANKLLMFYVLGYMELFLRHMCQSAEGKEFLDELDSLCTYQYDGSLLFKYIHIFVSA